MVVRAGAPVEAVDLTPGVAIGIPAYVFKSGAETVTSSITLQDDDDLAWTLVAGWRYEVDFTLSASSASNTPDFRSAWSVPGDATGLKFCMGPANAGDTAGSTTNATTGWVSRNDTNMRSSAHGFTTSLSYSIESNGSAIREWGWIESASGGTLRLQWAQQISNATGTTLSSNCFLKVTRIA